MENLRVTGENYLETGNCKLTKVLSTGRRQISSNWSPGISGYSQFSQKIIFRMFLEMVKPSHFETKNPSTTCFCSIRHRVKQQADLWRQVASELNKKLEAKVEFLRKDSLWNETVANEGLVSGSPAKNSKNQSWWWLESWAGGQPKIYVFGFLWNLFFLETKEQQLASKIVWKKTISAHDGIILKTMVVSHTFCIFIPNLGQMIQFDEYFFRWVESTTN